MVQARADDSALSHEFIQLGNAWTAFTSSCSWVPLGSTTFLGGFARLLVENRSDADWIENVANAFAAAGGGVLLDHALDLVATAVAPLSDQELLDALSSMPAKELAALMTASPGLRSQLGSMDPAKIYSWWTAMNPQAGSGTLFSSRQDLLLTEFPMVFGNLEGLPYTARDHANQIALKAAIADLEAQLAQLQAPSADLQEQLDGLHNIRKALQALRGSTTRHLISFTEDDPPLAAVSIGDLDTAGSVTYAVPGMGTTSSDMTGWAKAGQNLHDLLPQGSAVVAWIGYETPPVPGEGNVDFGVLDVNRAVAGGQNLAGALGGLAAVRGETMPQVNVVAHSYGTTTAAVTLTQPGVHVDNFITLGSAGLPDSVDTAADLNADEVYTGHARNKFPGENESGDQWAWIGRDASRDHKVNPMEPEFGSHTFGTETGGDAGRIVTDHSALMSDNGEQAGYLDRGTESLQNVAWVINGEVEKITEYAPLGPTHQQKALLEGMNGASL